MHVDPGAGWFPHVVGYADETGAGDGAGATRNLPLAPGHRRRGLAGGRARRSRESASDDAGAVVVSLGVDAAGDDPESPLQVTPTATRRPGELLAGTGPARRSLVQEGGYALDRLGPDTVAVLRGFSSP